MVRDVFRLAKENSPAIIFIDEIDAIATKRFDAQTGADREVQRILLELLNQMDGFDQTTNVKVGIAPVWVLWGSGEGGSRYGRVGHRWWVGVLGAAGQAWAGRKTGLLPGYVKPMFVTHCLPRTCFFFVHLCS